MEEWPTGCFLKLISMAEDKGSTSKNKRIDGKLLLIIIILLVLVVLPLSLAIWTVGTPITES